MRWELLAALLVLAPGLAAAHTGEGAHQGEGPHGGAAGGSEPPKQPGPWPPPAAANGTGNRTGSAGGAGPGAGPGPVDPGAGGSEPPSGREWTSDKGDPARTGATQAQAPRAPARRWDASGTVGVGILAAPVVVGNLVVFGGLDRKVHAVDATTGFPQWSTEVGGRVFASPAAAQGLVVVVPSGGLAVALDARNGTERWSHDLGGRASAAPLVANGVVYLLSEEGRLVALDLADGRERWNRTLPPVYSLVAPALVHGRLVVGDERGKVHALHPLTGATVWTADVKAPVTATPVGAVHRVVVPALGLTSLDADTGRVAWTRPAGAFVRSSPAFHGGVLVYGDPDQPGIVGANAGTGEPIWKVPTRLFVRASPVIAGEVAVASAPDGSILALRLRNGSLLWTEDAGERMQASPVVVEGRVFAARMDGLVRLFADQGAQSLQDPLPPVAPGSGNGFVDLLPVFAALGGPYLVLRRLRDRMRAQAAAEAQALPPPPLADAAVLVPQRPEPLGATVRVACPRCACRFGVVPRHHGVVACPACGMQAVMRRKPRAAGGGPPR